MDVYEKALLLHEQWQGKLSTERKLTQIRFSRRSSSRNEIDNFMPLIFKGSFTKPSASPFMK